MRASRLASLLLAALSSCATKETDYVDPPGFTPQDTLDVAIAPRTFVLDEGNRIVSATLADRVEKHMSPPLPIVGSGEAVSAAVAQLGGADALLVVAPPELALPEGTARCLEDPPLGGPAPGRRGGAGALPQPQGAAEAAQRPRGHPGQAVGGGARAHPRRAAPRVRRARRRPGHGHAAAVAHRLPAQGHPQLGHGERPRRCAVVARCRGRSRY